MGRGLVAVAAVLALNGCSAKADMSLATTKVDQFHTKINAGQFDAIYEEASRDLQAKSSQATLVQLLAAVHRKLGPFKTGKSVSWRDNVTTSGHFLIINYLATYEKGAAQESFVYRIDQKSAQLAGYQINSDALILN